MTASPEERISSAGGGDALRLAMIALSPVAISAMFGLGAGNRIVDHRKTSKPLGPILPGARSITSGVYAIALGCS